MRIGTGFDVHAFGRNRRLVLGGVEVDYELGLVGHSDADVLTHAVCDAVLGALKLGDIGELFPDSFAKYENICSLALLVEVCEMMRAKGYEIGNLDCVIIAQVPHLAPFKAQMCRTLAQTMQVDEDLVGVKATTTEHLGFTGRREGIAALATVLLVKKNCSER